MLNELDHELERRGHRFVRYADDMVILCRSKASAKQALEHIIPYIERKLFLKVNREKTVVSYAGGIKFLGYGFYKNRKGFQPRVHKKSNFPAFILVQAHNYFDAKTTAILFPLCGRSFD